MASFGVHSEVGKLRTVIVHRPELSLKRLTPDNHDELLFDDVLWVERAQWEHDQFVARMRERGVEVLLRPGPARRGARGERGCPPADHLASSPPKPSSARAWSRTSAPPCTRSRRTRLPGT